MTTPRTLPRTSVSPEPLYDARQVAKHLGCKPELVYRLCASGVIRNVRVGRLVRVPQSALDDFINGRTS